MKVEEVKVCVAVRHGSDPALPSHSALPRYLKGRIVEVPLGDDGVMPVGAYVVWTADRAGWSPTVTWHALAEMEHAIVTDLDDVVTRIVLGK